MSLYTLEDFVQWLATKDPAQTFDYNDYCNCAFAQFLKSKGHQNVLIGGRTYDIFEGLQHVVVSTYDIPTELQYLLSAAKNFGDLRTALLQ